MNKPDASLSANDLAAHWLPFTPNRQFKRAPRLISGAKDMHYIKPDGSRVLDGTAGLWCCNTGHCREPVTRAIQQQAGRLDYAPAFQFSHPQTFELANRLALSAPGGLDHVLFTNSGSEAVDTALKVALAYHQAKGDARRVRLIGRERGYHGVGFGGLSVGGIAPNRKPYGPLLNGVDHLPHTYNRAEQAHARGEPEWGGHLADALNGIIALHGAETIAAVIVEPMAGSTGVLAPPKGYLKRLREICTAHGILLIFDEVITGFGRLGTAWAADRFGVEPDMISFAKGVTSGAVPLGGVLVQGAIYDAFMTGPDHMIELFHGYTYSGHPLAVAAGLAALALYAEEDLFARSAALEDVWADATHNLKDLDMVTDIRTIGLVAGIDLEPDAAAPGLRGFEAMRLAFEEHDLMVRVTGDTLALSPPLIISKDEIAQLFDTLRKVLKQLDD
jgi:beta-alanine--pyruvate transaminase